jgi:hypothetical protein
MPYLSAVPVRGDHTGIGALCATLFASGLAPAQCSLLEAVLVPGSRFMSAALRMMGLALEHRYTNDHQVLDRVTWSVRQASRILLGLLIALLNHVRRPRRPDQTVVCHGSFLILLRGSAAIDHQFRPCHIGRLIGRQIQHAIGDLFRSPESAQRHPPAELRQSARIGLRAAHHGRINRAGMDGVTADVVLGVLHRRRLAEETHAALGRGVGG